MASYGRPMLALVTLVLQNTALVFTMKLTYRQSAREFHSASVVFVAEVLKLVICVFTSLTQREKHLSAMASIDWRGLIDKRMVVPSVLYILQNNLLFVAIHHLSPTVFLACSQSKVMFTAVFSCLFLGTSLNNTQICALGGLVFGMFLVQVRQVDTKENQLTDWGGISAVTLAALTSGYAGVYLEKILKSVVNVTIITQNVRLGIFAVPIAYVACLYQLSEDRNRRLFDGFDSVVVSVVLLQALGGLLVSAVMKYASALLKCYAISISICLCTTISVAHGMQEFSNTVACGIVLVVLSTLSYVNAMESSR